MACCCVKWCGKNTRNSNFSKNGISFHRFPTVPELKEKWINATQREDWFPQKHNVICSRHFASDCFDNSKKIRRLLKTAVPTLFLPVLVSRNGESESALRLENQDDSNSNFDKIIIPVSRDSSDSDEGTLVQTFPRNETEINIPGPSHVSVIPSSINIHQNEELSPKRSKMQRQIEHLRFTLNKKNKAIKMFQDKNRCQKKIINRLRDIFKSHKECCLTEDNKDFLNSLEIKEDCVE